MLLTVLYKSAFFFLSQSPQTPLYKYINDFFNISIITHNISTIFPIYLSQLTIYQRFFQYIYHNSQYINDFSNISIGRQYLTLPHSNHSQHILEKHLQQKLKIVFPHKKTITRSSSKVMVFNPAMPLYL
ncbi:hypothetical protein FQZ25_04400 [Bacillus thuringiensis]|nr:hypothetical protein FQZ25_04400 [Bacillus thuringiensis]